VKSAILRCELCSNGAVQGARLCAACAEMVKRVSDAQDRMTRSEEVVHEEPELLRKKAERAKTEAEKLTPIILG